MKQYSFLLFENLGGYARHGLKDVYKSTKQKYFINRGDLLKNKKDNIVQFIGKLISVEDLDIAKSILHKEKLKFNWSKIPKDVLNHISLILDNCTEDDYVEKLIIYRNSFLL